MKVSVPFFEDPIEVDEEEAASLARHGLVRDDSKPPRPAPAQAPAKEKTE
jgi:hypothetical protein